MRKSLYISIFLLLLGLSLPLLADDSREALSRIVSGTKEYTLSNGLKVIMYRRDNAPVFSAAVSVLAGGVDEKSGQTGISHMLEHMAFKGTDTIGTKDYAREKPLLEEYERLMQDIEKASPEARARLAAIQAEFEKLQVQGDFTRQIEKRGASGFNAFTGKETTTYIVSLPRQAFEFWCWIESERMVHPVMRQFYEERDVVLEERRMRFENKPEGRLYETMLGVIFRQHPYRNPVIGYETDLKQLSASQLAEFHKAHYVPENIAIGLAGDVDRPEDLAMLEKYFGRLPAGSAPQRVLPEEPAQQGQREVEIVAETSPQLMMAYRKVQYPHPDGAALDVMLSMLAEGRTSPLYRKLVLEKQLATDAGYFPAPGDMYPDAAFFYATVRRPHDNKELLAAFDALLESFIQSGVTEEELQIVKKRMSVAYLTGMSGSSKLAENFAQNQVSFRDWSVSFKYYDKLQQVGLEDVKRVARQYLRQESRTLGRLESVKEGA